MNAVIAPSRWQAKLDLDFSHRQDKTVISHRQHVGPLVIQKPFYPEQETCHVYLIHPPGGVVGGDRIELNVNVHEHAHALITTPAANKFYRSAGPWADVVQRFHVADDAMFEWLPQENILFDKANINLQTRIELGKQSRLLAWEMQCLGRPASQETFANGQLKQNIELWQDNKPLLIERSLIDGHSEMMSAQWGLAGFSVLATFILFPASTAELEEVRKIANRPAEDIRFSSSLIGEVLVCRGLAQQAEPLRALFVDIWQKLRPPVLNKTAVIPRIWNT